MDSFANFRPLPGATLIDNQIGAYRFANQGAAGERHYPGAQPLAVSLLMDCPARDELGIRSSWRQ